jgi:pyruvate dehydrogenase E1 component beta subunit
MTGLRPIIEFMSWSFTLVCLDQIVNNAANVRYMSGGPVQNPHHLPRRQRHRPPAWRDAQPSHGIDLCPHSGADRRRPSTPAEAKGLLKSSIRCDDPVIFLESEKMLNDTGEVPDEANSRFRWASPMSNGAART